MQEIPGYRILRIESPLMGKLTEIICESLPGGPGNQENILFFPGGKTLRIKSFVKEHDRFRLRIKGITRSSLCIGGVLVSSTWPVTETHDALLLPDGKPIPTESETVRGGLCPDFNRERLIGRGNFRLKNGFLSIRFPTPYPMFPGAELTISGEHHVLRNFTVLWPGIPSREELRRLNHMARRRPHHHPEATELYGRILHIRGFVEIPPPLYDHNREGLRRIDSWLILRDRQIILEKKILRIVSRPGGADTSLLRIQGYPEKLVSTLTRKMCHNGILRVRCGWFFPANDTPLSPYHRGLLKKVEDLGKEGLRVRAVTDKSDQKALEVLHRSGFIKGGVDLWFSVASVALLKDCLMDGRKKGERISMVDARKSLGGSRTRALELLSILDSEGILLRTEDQNQRIIV